MLKQKKKTAWGGVFNSVCVQASLCVCKHVYSTDAAQIDRLGHFCPDSSQTIGLCGWPDERGTDYSCSAETHILTLHTEGLKHNMANVRRLTCKEIDSISLCSPVMHYIILYKIIHVCKPKTLNLSQKNDFQVCVRCQLQFNKVSFFSFSIRVKNRAFTSCTVTSHLIISASPAYCAAKGRTR